MQILWASVFLVLAGCASTPEEPPTARELYEQAHELQNSADYEQAIEKFDELVATYPASSYAQQGMLDLIYLQYNRTDYDGAVAAAGQFMSAYPDSPNVAYALYLEGLTYFREDQSLIDRLGFQDPTERNPDSMRLAFLSFKKLLDSYPDSKYAEDSANRMRYLINALARHEVHIANYYLQRNAVLGAINRAKLVLDIYPDSASSEEALSVLARAYEIMGAKNDKQKTLRLLEINFPDNPLVKNSDN
ncbi:outer membrane protein assembly factor BamD [Candidatus Persebacteraceae bacterium Df01]|jgi:outer membrane protein assembly factor BamD|uniref:Outer membrane protein assembly factor BamD n=1 Tax=Candidatus Doriopsillibacter californiensis TaxID=2970740 RepID=A0ABT7QL38_9GAMM|nr:outer membrane protein assembly factor BamD [Candidatus Persebacteraceae bacterium Df01]